MPKKRKNIRKDKLLSSLNSICQQYFNIGFEVTEIVMPLEFKKILDEDVWKGNLKGIEINCLLNDYSGQAIKIFVSQAKHMQFILQPI